MINVQVPVWMTDITKLGQSTKRDEEEQEDEEDVEVRGGGEE